MAAISNGKNSASFSDDKNGLGSGDFAVVTCMMLKFWQLHTVKLSYMVDFLYTAPPYRK